MTNEIDLDEAAALLNTTRQFICTLIERSDLPARYADGQAKIPRDRALAYQEAKLAAWKLHGRYEIAGDSAPTGLELPSILWADALRDFVLD